MLTTITAEDVQAAIGRDPLLLALGALDMGSSPEGVTSPRQGYFVGGLNAHQVLTAVKVEPWLSKGVRGVGRYPSGSYVVDSPEQFLERFHDLLEADERRLAVFFTPIRTADQHPEGGWRWHKWGEYLGDHEPQCEYLYDEPDIENVYVVHIEHVKF